MKDLYVKIPITETIDIARAQLLKCNNKNITEQICTQLEMVLQQNYFEFQEQIYRPIKEWPWDLQCQASLLKYFYKS